MLVCDILINSDYFFLPMPKNSKIKSIALTAGRKKIEWVNVTKAGKREIAALRERFSFADEHLHMAFSNIDAMHAQVYGGRNYVFAAIRFPALNTKENIITGEEVDFFIGRNYIVVLHSGNIKAVSKLFTITQKEHATKIAGVDSPIDILYHIIDALLEHTYDLLDGISKASDEAEDLIFSGRSWKVIDVLLDLRRNAINLRTITKNYQSVFEKLDRTRKEVQLNDARTPYSSVIEKTKDLWNMIENRQEMIEALYATNESISNYRLNDIMKTLTIFSVIVFPLTLLAAIFGMNTMNGMPFVDTPNGFWWIIIIMLLGSLGMLLFFKRKRWL